MENRKVETRFDVCSLEELDNQEQTLVKMAKWNVHKSYAPYSNFKVGAAVLLENGEIFTGNNQENAAYPSGLCAERTSIFYANAAYPEEPVKTLAIAAFTNGIFLEEPITPCGSCRQVLLETEKRFGKEMKIILYGTKNIYVIHSASDLLPLCFDKLTVSNKK